MVNSQCFSGCSGQRHLLFSKRHSFIPAHSFFLTSLDGYQCRLAFQNFSLNGRTSISVVQELRSWWAICQYVSAMASGLSMSSAVILG